MLDDKGTFVSGAETAIDKDGMSKAAIKKLEKAQEDACVARAKHGKASPATKQLAEMGEKMLGAVEKIDAGAASSSSDSGMFMQMLLMMGNTRRADREHKEIEQRERDRIRALERERDREVERERAAAANQQQQVITAVLASLMTKLTKD